MLRALVRVRTGCAEGFSDLAVRLYWRVASGANTARIATTQMQRVGHRMTIDQGPSGRGARNRLPEQLTGGLRQVDGFHAANVFSAPGRLLIGTKVFAMNVIGKITMNDALLTTSGLGTISPTNAITHEIAYANSSSSRKPPAASRTSCGSASPRAGR